MPIEILSCDSYKNYVAKVNEGNNETTHLAMVDFGDGAIRSVVKLHHESSRGLYNEIIGYCLAKELCIPQPDHAAFIEIDTSLLPSNPSWITERYWGAWCTEYVAKKSIKPWYDNLRGVIERPADKKTKKALKKISSDLNLWLHSSRTAAFDEWTGNNDRNFGNLIRMGKGNYRVIDHGQLFGNTQWDVAHPDLDTRWANKLCDILEINKDKYYVFNAMIAASDNHQLALDNMLDIVLDLLHDDITNTDAKFLQDFFTHRADPERFKALCGFIA